MSGGTRLFVQRLMFRSGRINRMHKLLSCANRQATVIELLLVDEYNPKRTHAASLSPASARALAGSLLYFANLLEGGEGTTTLQLLPNGDIMAALSTVTREQVLAVLEEYDRIGEEAFLSKHNFRKGRFMLVRGRKRYHSKAVFGVAMGKSAAEFSGGAAHVQKAAERLGLTVIEAAS